LKKMSDTNQGSGFGWFLLGLGLGAAVGVLYAPKPGNETRDDLFQGAKDGGEYLKQKSRAAADQFNNLVAVGKDQATEYVDRGREVIDRGRGQWEHVVDRGRQVISEQTGKVAAAVDAGKQAYRSTTAGDDRV
jgi:gas vesicle protein